MIAYYRFYQGFSTEIWSMTLVTLFNAIGYVVMIFLPFFLHDQLQFPAKDIAIFISCYSLVYAIGTYIGGKLNDYFSPTSIMLSSLLLRSLAGIALFFSYSSLFILTILLVMGLADGTFRPASNIKLMNACDEDDRARVNGLYRTAINIGLGLAAAAGILIHQVGYHWVFLLTAIINLIAMAIIFYMPASQDKPSPNQPEKTKIKPSIFQDKIFLLLCLIVIINNISYGQLGSMFPVYLQTEFAITPQIYGYLLMLNTGMVILLQVPLLSLLKNFNQYRVAMLGCFLLGGGMSVLLLGDSIFWVILSIITWTTGQILALTTLFAIVFNRTNKSNRGNYVGIYYLVIALTGIIAPLIGGWLYQFQNGQLLWLACLALGATNVLLLLLCQRKVSCIISK